MRTGEENLRRSLRFLDVYALAVGGVIGVGIFFLPDDAARAMGPAAVVPFVVAAVLASLVVLCFAEAGSRFEGTGGAMTYARVALGDLAGFEVGWATWISRVASWAALSNIFVDSLAPLWPGAENARAALIVGLIAVLTAMNLRGVGFGARLNTVLTAAKLVPILLFIAVGLFCIDDARFAPFAPHGYDKLGETTVLVLFAYVGFEGLVIPAAEMRNPQRTVPAALLSGMATIALLYLGIWAVCTGTLAGLADASSPVGEAAATFLGPIGTGVVQVGIVVSVVGINAFMALVTPRMLYAMSHADLLPQWFGAVNSRRVPGRAIWLTSLAVLALALIGTFKALALVSVVARIAQYVPTCVAVLRLRGMADAPAASFRVPFGPVLPLLAIAVCVWLLTETPTEELVWGVVVIGAGLSVYVPWRALRRGGPTS